MFLISLLHHKSSIKNITQTFYLKKLVIPAQAGIHCVRILSLHLKEKNNKLTFVMKSGGWVYILSNKKMGTLYIGSTTDLIGRTWQHKNHYIPGFTSKYNIDKLVYYEWHDNLNHMVARERQIKEWRRSWKLRLIIDFNPDWLDLYNNLLIKSGYTPE